MISRRSFLASTAGASAIGAGGMLAAASVEPTPRDPLLEVLTEYRADLHAFNASGDLSEEENNALMDATWGPFWRQMNNGEATLPAATTAAGALLALRCALEEQALDPFEEQLVQTALAFFGRSAP